MNTPAQTSMPGSQRLLWGLFIASAALTHILLALLALETILLPVLTLFTGWDAVLSSPAAPSTIGVIGGADGPTAIYIATRAPALTLFSLLPLALPPLACALSGGLLLFRRGRKAADDSRAG